MTRLLLMAALGMGSVYADSVPIASSVSQSPASPVSTASSLGSKLGLPASLSVKPLSADASNVDTTSVPEPGSALLLGTGLLAVSFGARRMTRKR